MPSLTRQQASLQATDALVAGHDDEPSRNADATSVFSKLPPELQITVVEYVTQPSDLKNMCQASKELHALALPFLYRDVRLMIYQLNKKLSKAFTASHPGLPHVQTLRIRDWRTPCFDNNEHLPVLRHLLKVLRKDSLRIFELHTTNAVHQDVGLLLRNRQRQLMNHQYLRLLPESTPFTPPIWTMYGIGHISCLQLFLDSGHDCKIAKHLLNHMPLVTDLSIILSPHRLQLAIRGEGEAGRRVVNDVFDPTTATRRGQNLKRLRIENMSFELAGAILPTALALGDLEHLHLISCTYTNRLCESMAQLQLCLRSFHNQSSHEEMRTGMTDVFVQSLRGLRGLRLSRRSFGSGEYETCAFASLLPHAHELRFLEFDDYEPFVVAFADTRRSMADFSTFCSHATQLQQLSIQSPSFAEVDWKRSHGLQAFLNCLQNLRSLRVLKLTTQLTRYDELDSDSDDDDDVVLDELRSLKLDKACKEKEEKAKVVADHIFEALGQTCPFFVAVSVDVNDPTGGTLSNLEFLRVKQTDLLGKTSLVARSVKSGTIKYYEPCSEILGTVHEVDVFE